RGRAAVPSPHGPRDPDEAHHGAGTADHRSAAGGARGSCGLRDAVAREGPGGPLAESGRTAACARGPERDHAPGAAVERPLPIAWDAPPTPVRAARAAGRGRTS